MKLSLNLAAVVFLEVVFLLCDATGANYSGDSCMSTASSAPSEIETSFASC